jgi:hypothetical protein
MVLEAMTRRATKPRLRMRTWRNRVPFTYKTMALGTPVSNRCKSNDNLRGEERGGRELESHHGYKERVSLVA